MVSKSSILKRLKKCLAAEEVSFAACRDLAIDPGFASRMERGDQLRVKEVLVSLAEDSKLNGDACRRLMSEIEGSAKDAF